VTDAVTRDDFLGGKLRLLQPVKGYRAGVDPVLLAASVEAVPGQEILELGCGVGAALFCLGRRVSGLQLTGVELQPLYADLARQNAAENGIPAEIHTADLRALPDDIRLRSFDHVLMNPPYLRRQTGTTAADLGRDTAFAGATDLSDWVAIGAKRVRPKGWLTVIQKIDRMPEVLTALASHAPHFGSVALLPIAGRQNRAPNLFLLQARNGGRAPFHLSPTLTLHESPEHPGDIDDYRPEVGEILRNAACLSIRR